MQSRLVLLALLAVVLIAGLLLGWDEIFPGPLEDGADPVAQAPPDLLQAEGPGDVAATPGLAGRAGTEQDAERPPRGDVEVLVLGRGLEPFPGVYVGVRTTAARGIGPLVGKPLATAFDGRVVLKDLPYDGSHVLHFYKDDPFRKPGAPAWRPLRRQGDGKRSIPITGPRHLFAADTGFWMTVRMVDTETGRDVKGAQLRGHRSREKSRAAWVKAPARFFVAPGIGRDAHLGFTTAPLAGWSIWERNEIRTRISPYVRELLYVYPLRRELPLTVALVDGEGRAMEAKFKELSIGAQSPRQLSWDTDAFGRLVFKGVPWLRDELVLLEVESKDKNHVGLDLFRIPSHEGARVSRTVPVNLPHFGFEVGGHPDVVWGGSVGGTGFGGRSAYRHDNELIVTVLRRNGAPAIGCLVRMNGVAKPVVTARTDAQGRVRFRDLPPRKLAVVVRQAGLLPMAGEALMKAQGATRMTLREGRGGTLEIEAVDDDGKPLSYATVLVLTPSKLPWLDVQDEVQRVDPFTDHRGRKTLRHLEPGGVVIQVTWASRSVSRRIDVVDGGTKRSRFVLLKPQRYKGEGK